MIEQLKIWWAGLSEREAQLSLLSAALLFLAAVYWGAWKPLTDQFQESEKKLKNAQQTLIWVQDKVTVLLEAGVSEQEAVNNQLTLTQIVNASAKQYGVKFSRIENKDKQIEVWITDIKFDLFIRWLTALNNQYLVSVITTDFSKIAPQGHIKVNRLLLSK
jgi:general secretion pathway protein M